MLIPELQVQLGAGEALSGRVSKREGFGLHLGVGHWLAARAPLSDWPHVPSLEGTLREGLLGCTRRELYVMPGPYDHVWVMPYAA